jgi:NAD+ diphosphatase
MTKPGFTGSPLDRADAARHDPARVAAMRRDPAAGLLLLDGLAPVRDGDRLRIVPVAEAPAGAELALLGLLGGAPTFVALTPGVTALARSPGLFEAVAALRAEDVATWGAARSLVDWHARHRFCPRCGGGTGLFRAGWGRLCDVCRAEHFPRTDPVVIMLAEHGEGRHARVLVGRQPGFPPGRYSALAGFLEPGESIEEAVARELHEEAGVAATAVRYVASQPWPFPSQLMIACVARVRDDAITLDEAELEDAIWVDRASVAAAMAGEAGAPFLPPPPYAIAYTLFARWLEETA